MESNWKVRKDMQLADTEQCIKSQQKEAIELTNLLLLTTVLYLYLNIYLFHISRQAVDNPPHGQESAVVCQILIIHSSQTFSRTFKL